MSANTRLICVDDEEMILELFTMILAGKEVRPGLVDGPRFELAVFSSGESAARAVASAAKSGRPFCGGFFDLKLANGDDGVETIRSVRAADPRLLCCVVSADPTAVGRVEPIFQGRAEDWMFLAKPVGVEEVRRRAVQMVSEWERRRRDETTERALRAELETTRVKLRQAEHLSDIGLIAAGVGQEIASPVGFVQANVSALASYCDRIGEVLDAYRFLVEEARSVSALAPRLKNVEEVRERTQIDRIRVDLHPLLSESLQGLERIREIVSALESMSHFGRDEPAPSDWNACVESALLLAGADLKPKARVERAFGQVRPLRFHTGEISQVLINVLVNAAQAIASQGTIRVETFERDGWAVAEISDDGCGIPAVDLERIFDAFFTTKAPGDGIGLGLAVSRDIVERHGGRIEVDSGLGKGTTFRILVPLEQSSGPARNRREDVA